MGKIDTLCVVDDDEIFRFLTQRLVEESNLVDNVKMFSNGKAVLNFLKSVCDKPEEIPDVILLDLTMPIMDGWQFLEDYISLKPNLGKQITIYLVTSSIAPEDMRKARTISEVTDFVVKPMTEEKFRKIAEEVTN